jgi:hypothetical protein
MKRSMLRGLPAGLVIAAVILAAVGSNGGITGITGGKHPVADPDAGLTVDERLARHTAERLEFEKRITAWFESFDPASVDLRSLEHHERLSSYDDPAKDLDEAVSIADAIIVGSVVEVRFDRDGAVVTLDVDQALKGGPVMGTAVIRQASGVWPTPDWKGVFIVDAPNDPLLLPGERVVLLLNRISSPGADFEVQSVTGHYRIASQAIIALEANPFRSLVHGESESAFARELAQAIGRTR